MSLPIDVAVPDAPERPMPGAHRLNDLPRLAADLSLMMAMVGAPLTGPQVAVLPLALDALLFGEQQ